jgi:hypothetical protein
VLTFEYEQTLAAQDPKRVRRCPGIYTQAFGHLSGRRAGYQPVAFGHSIKSNLFQGHPRQRPQLAAKGPAGSRKNDGGIVVRV